MADGLKKLGALAAVALGLMTAYTPVASARTAVTAAVRERYPYTYAVSRCGPRRCISGNVTIYPATTVYGTCISDYYNIWASELSQAKSGAYSKAVSKFVSGGWAVGVAYTVARRKVAANPGLNCY